jgi:uncharacterized protein YkwD
MKNIAFSVVAGLSCGALAGCSSSDGITPAGGSSAATSATTVGTTTGGGSSAGGSSGSDASSSSATTAVANTTGSPTTTGQALTSTGAGGSASTSASVTTSTTGGGGAPDSERSPTAVCARWNADRADMSEGTWSGSVESCDPGDIAEPGRANALRLYNLYRWLADLPPVETSDERNQLAQACALMMEANGMLSHSPGTDWDCYTEAGAEGASSSNISSGASVRSVDGYMLDNGNETTIGHRRWILSNSLGPIGIGSTGEGSSCMQNLQGTGDAGKEWLAWPPPGVLPYEAYAPGQRGSLGDTGWTIQSDSLDLSSASVTVSSGGGELPVTVTQLQGGYGSREAIRFNPDGWEAEAGQTYSVVVSGVDAEMAYDVELVDCSN